MWQKQDSICEVSGARDVKGRRKGWAVAQVITRLPTMHKALGSGSKTTKHDSAPL